jgi:hypothetical protein
LERAYPPLLWVWHHSLGWARRGWAWVWPRLRPLLALLFKGLAAGERWLRRAAAMSARIATAASRGVTPPRAAALVLIASGALLVASQFIDYRAVEIGQPGYSGLPEVAPVPTTGEETAGAAHLYLLIPVGVAAMALGVLALRRERKRLGLLVVALGLLSLALILLVDLPHGLDEGSQASHYAGTSAVLEDGFYAELAAAGAMVLSGLLYYARPCRIRISLSGRAARARRRRPRPRASSRAKVARSA